MELIKVQNIKNPNVIKEVKKTIASYYIGTGEWTNYIEKPVIKEEKKSKKK